MKTAIRLLFLQLIMAYSIPSWAGSNSTSEFQCAAKVISFSPYNKLSTRIEVNCDNEKVFIDPDQVPQAYYFSENSTASASMDVTTIKVENSSAESIFNYLKQNSGQDHKLKGLDLQSGEKPNKFTPTLSSPEDLVTNDLTSTSCSPNEEYDYNLRKCIPRRLICPDASTYVQDVSQCPRDQNGDFVRP